MTRVASLYLPQLAIERHRRFERLRRSEPSTKPPERGALPPPIAGSRRDRRQSRRLLGAEERRLAAGARWARDGALPTTPTEAEIDALPAHRRPAAHERSRRSEAVEHPFRAMPPDEGIAGNAPVWPQPVSAWARPLILIERVGQKDVVTAACPAALDLGLRAGMAAAHARALVPDLDVREADPDRDRALLDRLALYAVGHWTPTASVSDTDGLWLDLSGTTHLFGGEERFCRHLLRFLHRLGFSAAVAITGTPGAAHALAGLWRQRHHYPAARCRSRGDR